MVGSWIRHEAIADCLFCLPLDTAANLLLDRHRKNIKQIYLRAMVLFLDDPQGHQQIARPLCLWGTGGLWGVTTGVSQQH